MKIVEYAIKMRDMATPAINTFGAKVTKQAVQVKEYTDRVQSLNRCYKSSYSELQAKIQETESVIRNSVLKSEIRNARHELTHLQKQAAKHHSGMGGGGDAMAGGTGMSMGKMLKGGAIIGAVVGAGAALKNFATEAQQAYIIQDMAEKKLAVIMKQRMGATNEQINAVKQLASEQQKVGVIGDEVQLAGGQQLGTFLNKTESLKTLLPAMNNLLAQQKGLNATDQDAVGIGNLMGKVMQGQTSALTRVGVSFNEAEEKVLKFGNEQERAAMLAQVIKNNVGEMNKELAKTDLGKLKQDSNNDGDRMERFGQLATKMQVALLPLDDIADSVMESFIPIIADFIPTLQNGVLWIVEAINTAKPYLAEMVAPAIGLWNQLKGSAAGLIDYVEIVANLWTTTIYPVVSRVWTSVCKIVGELVNWISKSNIIKGAFSFIAGIFKTVFEIIGAIMTIIEWTWNNVLKPILDKIDSIAAMLGVGNITITTVDKKGKQTTQKVELPAKQEDTTKENTKAISDLSTNIAGNRTSAASAESSIAGGGSKVVNINVAKFFDNINFNTQNLTESVADIEAAVTEALTRILFSKANS